MMHGFTRGLERRLEALEKRLAGVLEPETAAETSRRLELCRMALASETPEDLTPEEMVTFPKIQASVPILQEIVREGLVGDDGLPVGGYYPHHEDGDETHDGDGEFTWHP